MTTPERELLDQFLNGYLKPRLDGVAADVKELKERVGSLETTRSEEQAVREDRRARDARNRDMFRWQLATAFTFGSLLITFLHYAHLI